MAGALLKPQKRTLPAQSVNQLTQKKYKNLRCSTSMSKKKKKTRDDMMLETSALIRQEEYTKPT